MSKRRGSGSPGSPGSPGSLSAGIAVESCTFEVREDKAKVAVRVKNRGKSPLFVVTQVRRLTLDDGGATLTLWMTERGAPTPAQPMRHLSMPTIAAIQAGEERTIETELPETMTRLLAIREGGELDFDTLDIGAAERVVVKLTVAETPFYFNRAMKDRKDLLGQLQGWGEDVEVAAERTGPRRPGKPNGGKRALKPARRGKRPGKPRRTRGPGKTRE